MGLRVHELAKEFKISTVALKQHLKDLGIEVKSHMSVVDDAVVAKIRAKFSEQKEAIRRRETEKKEYYRHKKTEHKKKPVREKVENPFSKAIEKEEKRIMKSNTPRKSNLPKRSPSSFAPILNTSNKPVLPKDNKSQKRNFAENNRKFSERRESSNNRTDDGTRRSYTPRNNYRGNAGVRQNTGGSNQTRSTGNTNSRFSKRTDRSQQRPDVRNKPLYSPRAGIKKTSPIIVEKKIPTKTVFGKTKKQVVEFGASSKHLKAKISLTKSKKKYKKVIIDDAEIRKQIKLNMSSSKKKNKPKKEEKKSKLPETEKIITISEFTSISELAKIMDVAPTEIITKFFAMGKMVTMNHRLDKESLEMICDEFDFDVKFKDEYGTEIIDKENDKYVNIEDVERPPVVTVMGHVDHGKTSILDKIRHKNIVGGESGGITQHIGAYQVSHQGKKITFLDTPGHEAFTSMRARGSDVTDIAVIVVAANDGVKPQTIEAIDHAKAAGVTMIVAINKIDLPEANIDRTIAGLAENNVYLENYGGDVVWVKCSAKTGEGIDDLLENILLVSEMKELKAKRDVPARGVVIESKLDSKRGVIATILIQEGILRKTDIVICGDTFGRIRKMVNEDGKDLKFLEPSDVGVIFGLSSIPKAGDVLNCVETDKIARQISTERRQIRREREKFHKETTLDTLGQKIKEQGLSNIKIILKADSDGSVGALSDTLQKLSNDEVLVKIIHSAVGGISENDVTLAQASKAIIIGFHVRATSKASKAAEEKGVEINLYTVIYDAVHDVESAILGLLAPEFKERNLGTAVAKEIFKIKKIGTIAGCAVTKGLMKDDALFRLFRNNIQIHEGKISSLKHYQNDVKEVKAGMECGIGFKDFNDIRVDDVIEAFEMYEVERKL